MLSVSGKPCHHGQSSLFFGASLSLHLLQLLKKEPGESTGLKNMCPQMYRVDSIDEISSYSSQKTQLH